MKNTGENDKKEVTLISEGYGARDGNFFQTYILYGWEKNIPGSIEAILSQEEYETMRSSRTSIGEVEGFIRRKIEEIQPLEMAA